MIAAFLFTVPEGISFTKLVAENGAGSYYSCSDSSDKETKERASFNKYANVEDDDELKPGEYTHISIYEDVDFATQKSSHYKCVHSFLVPNPIKFWHLSYTEKTARFYDIFLNND